MAYVTKSKIIQILESNDRYLIEQYIGRALVALFNRQVEDEKKVNHTRHENSLGFSSADAKDGSITAKYFIKHRSLQDWQIQNWTRDFRGSPRISKYSRQLNEIAEQKRKGA